MQLPKFVVVLLIIAALPLLAVAQPVFKGIIKNHSTKQPIPFAVVSLAQENIGTNANEEGIFNLAFRKPHPNDTLIISC